jgi:hypothetical protein
MNRIRGLILVMLASPVIAAVVACVALKMMFDLLGGVGFQRGDGTTIAIASIGGLAVIGISARAIWRERASMTWQLYGLVLAIAVTCGAIFGGVQGVRMSDEHVAYVRNEASETCRMFADVHRDLGPECIDRAIDCRREVEAAPPTVDRGLGAGAPRAGEPTDPIERAVWVCLAQP